MELKEALKELNKATQDAIITFSELEKSDNIVEICKAFKELHEQLDSLEVYHKELNRIYEKFSTVVLPQVMEDNNLGDSVKLFGRTFSINVRPFFSIPQDKEEKGFAWVRSMGLESLIKPKVNAQSLSSAVSEMVKEKGILPPEDCVSTHIKKYISIRKT